MLPLIGFHIFAVYGVLLKLEPPLKAKSGNISINEIKGDTISKLWQSKLATSKVAVQEWKLSSM